MQRMAEASTVAAAVWIIATVACVFFLRNAAQLLIPIVLAILISYALEPVVAWFQQRRVPRTAGAAALLLLIVGSAAWGTFSLRDDAAAAFDELPALARRMREFVVSQGTSGPGQRVKEAVQELQKPAQPDDKKTPSASSPAREQAAAASAALTEWIGAGVGSLVALAGHLTVIIFLVFFLLISGGHFKERITEIAGPRRDDRRTRDDGLRSDARGRPRAPSVGVPRERGPAPRALGGRGARALTRRCASG